MPIIVFIKVDHKEGPKEVKNIDNLKKYMNALNTSENGTENNRQGPKTSSAIDISRMAKSVLDFRYSKLISTPAQEHDISPDNSNKGNDGSQSCDPEAKQSNDPRSAHAYFEQKEHDEIVAGSSRE